MPMFCPKCGATHSDDLNFCKSCGANLGIVREAIQTGQPPPKFDWSKTWVAEMLQSSEQAVLKERELERLKGITPEVKRRNEIKAGVITSSVGLAVMVFLYFMMQGIILAGDIKPGDEFILSRVWIAGFIPVMIGIALIINGVFVSRLFSRNDEISSTSAPNALGGQTSTEYLPPADTNDLFPAGFSVTDETTRHLAEPIKQKRS